MAGVLTKDGIASKANYAGTVQAWLNTLTLHLFKNNVVPGVTNVLADFTECAFPGYAAVAWNTWGAPAFDGNNNYQFAATRATFTSTGASVESVYGYYATDGAGKCVLAEANGSPFAINAAGLQYFVDGNFYEGEILPPL